MRAIHKVVCSAVALVVLGVAAVAVEAPASAVKMADAPAPAAVAAAAPAQGSPTSSSALSTETQSIHVQVGRSIILNTQARLRRIVVSNPDVLDTATISPTQLVITAKAPGSSSLVLWDESSNARIVDVYADVDVAGLRESIRSAHPDEQVIITSEEGKIVLTGSVTTRAAADDMVRLSSLYSKAVVDSMVVQKPPRAKQVLLKVQFLEIDRTKLSQLGLNVFSTGAAGNIGSLTTQQFGAPFTTLNIEGATIGAPLTGSTFKGPINNLMNLFIFRPDLNLGATIQALQQKNVAQILAEPNLLARSGEPAKFLAGGEFPVPVVQGGGGQNNTAITVVFKPFGVKLEFTGTIEGNVVRLKIAPEVSTIDLANALLLQGFSIPAVSTRRAETEIELKDGQTFAMAGLLDQRTTKQLSKIPGIGDIPVLGNLFRSRSLNQTNTELVVMVTPQIVDPVSEAVAAPAAPAMPLKNMDQPKFDESVKKPIESGNIN
jgi:pilus assembly protein CpaC